MLRLLVFFAAIGAVFLGGMGLILVASGAFSGTVADIAWGAALIVPPAVGYFALRHAARQQGRAAFQAKLDEGFAADHHAWYAGSGLAISSVRREILVAGPTTHKVYRLEEFEHAQSIFTRDIFYGMDGIIGAILIVLGLGRLVLGYFTDGLFVRFGDGSNWRITGLRRKDAETWEERLAARGMSVKP